MAIISGDQYVNLMACAARRIMARRKAAVSRIYQWHQDGMAAANRRNEMKAHQ